MILSKHVFYQGDRSMVSNFCPRREPLRNVLLLLLLLAGVVSACGTSITSSASPTPTSTSTQGMRGIFHEYSLPPSPFVPGTITAGPDGNLWFTEIMIDQNGSTKAGKIERITPTGTVSEFPLPSTTPLATAITVGPDGNLWFSEGDKIGRITTTGKITEFPLPSTTTFASSIIAGPDGNLWFTEQSKIGRMTLTGQVSEFSLPSHQYPAGAHPIKAPASSGPNQPLAITAGADGNLWFTELGPAVVGASIGRITTTGKITEFLLPSTTTLPSSITAGPDGNLWFTETGTRNGPSKIGVITPQGKIREFTLPHSILGSITKGPEGNLWFTEFQYSATGTTAGEIGRITTAGKMSGFPLPTASNSPISITFGADHTLWFIEVKVTPTDPNGTNGKIGHLV
jgi:virginiamycin B lyase